MISHRFDFIEYTKLETFEKVFIINEIWIEMIDKKIVNFIEFLSNDDEIIVQLQKVLHVFQLSANLFSTTYIIKKDEYVIFDKNDCTIFEKKIDKFVLHVFKSRNQYSLNLIKQKAQYIAFSISFNVESKYNEQFLQFWHRRTSHLNFQNLIRLTSMSSNMKFIKISKNTLSLCDFCKINKTKTKFSRRSQNLVFEKNECIDVDLKNSIDLFIWDEKKYYCLMICKVIKFTFVYLFATKNEFYDTIEKHFIFMIKTQTFNHKIKRWRIDENDEFANNRTKKFFAKHNIQWEFSTLYIKKQNDIAKRKNYIVIIVVRVILKDNDLF